MRSLAARAIARPAGAAGRPARAPSAAARFRAPAASSGDAWRGPRGYHARGSRARRARGSSSSRDAASSAAPGGAGGDDDDDIAGSVERSAKLLDLVIQETIEQIFVEEAAEEVLPDDDDDSDPSSPSPASAASAVDKEAILRGVIAKHLNEFDGSFLAAVSAYVQVAESSGDFGLLSLLAAIREEVISAVSGEMQPDIQVVQLLARLADGSERAAVLQKAHNGGGEVAGQRVPAADIDAVEHAAARLVDEMETREHIPSWQLLWQLLLARETTRQMHPKADEFGVYGDTVFVGSHSPSEIPRAEAAMIKELCVVNEAAKRRALVAAKFEECRELDEASVRDAGGKIKLKRSTRGFAARPNPNDLENGAPSMDVFDVRDVRPGRLVDCVINMRVALQREGADQRVIDRLTAIYFETCDVALEMADKGARAIRAEEERAGGGAAPA